MHAIRIQRLRAHYHLPPSAGGQRRRLDGLLASALNQSLEPALDRAGLAPDEHLCIRQLSVPVRLRLSAPDPSLVATWGGALADALWQAAEQGLRREGSGRNPVVVWFASTAHAFLDFGLRVARHDLRHAWAWRQLDLWRAEENASAPAALREFLWALLRNPDRIVSTLGFLAGTPALAALARRFEADHWIALAAAALGSAGVAVHAADLRSGPGLVGTDKFRVPKASPAGPEDKAVIERSPVDRIAHLSQLGRVVPMASVPPAASRALASLVLLDADPGWTLRSRDRWNTALSELADPRPAGESRAEAELCPTGPSDDAESSGSGRASSKKHPTRETTEVGGESGEATSGFERAASRRSEQGEVEVETEADGPTPDPRRRERTLHGGLLFVLNVLNTPSWLDRLAACVPGRGLRWVLIQLAMALAPVESTDPATVAFAGLPLSSEPIPTNDAVLSSEARDAVDRLAEGIREDLAGRLDRLGLSPEAAAEFVCARPAGILTDPGWIEVRFALTEVSTDLRRAGLDKDPGYLRWLGCVVKFVYE